MQDSLTEAGYLSIYLSDGTVSKQLSVRQGAYLKNYRSAKKSVSSAIAGTVSDR
jgi:hypothetical protein